MFNLSKTLLCFVISGKEGRLQVYGPELKYHRKYSLCSSRIKTTTHLAGFLEGRVWKGGWGAEAELLMKQFYDSLKNHNHFPSLSLLLKVLTCNFLQDSFLAFHAWLKSIIVKNWLKFHCINEKIKILIKANLNSGAYKISLWNKVLFGGV